MGDAPALSTRRTLLLAAPVAGLALVALLHRADRRRHDIVGHAALVPTPPSGSGGVTVRLALPPDSRVRYTGQSEAVVETAAGDRLFYVAAALVSAVPPPLAEYRATARGPVWVQRLVGPGELALIRYGEAWRGLVLETDFYVAPSRAGELEPVTWRAVQESVVSEDTGRP